MLPGDLLLSVNTIDLAKQKNIPFSEFCQRIAQSSTSTVRKFIIQRKNISEHGHSSSKEELYFELPQGHLGMNFNGKDLNKPEKFFGDEQLHNLFDPFLVSKQQRHIMLTQSDLETLLVKHKIS